MKSKTSLESKWKPLQQTKPATLSVSSQLTRSEIDFLRQKKKQLNDYGLKAFKDKIEEMGGIKNH